MMQHGNTSASSRAKGLAVCLLMGATSTSSQASELSWKLAWAEEFNGTTINTNTWEVLTRQNSFNNEKQYYLPGQASVANGTLRIRADNTPFGGKLYRSARLESYSTFLFGRLEARAKIPTTKGIWPAIWMFPNRNVAWPLGGEIDIMEHGGSNPHRVSSAYHWNNVPNTSQYRTDTYDANAITGLPVRWPDAFHTYAVEWEPQEVRFYVDGYNHFTVVDPSAPTGYKPDAARLTISSTPMNLVINTAVGGWFDGDPDASTAFPQVFEVDYVRHATRLSNGPLLDNGGFEVGNSAWTLTGSAAIGPTPAPMQGVDSTRSLRLDALNASATQYLWGPTIGSADTWSLAVRHEASAPLTGGATLVATVRFLSATDTVLGTQTFTLLDASAATGLWHTRTLAPGTVPTGTAYQFINLRWQGGGSAAGIGWVDHVSRVRPVVPEPGTIGMGISAIGLLAARRPDPSAR